MVRSLRLEIRLQLIICNTLLYVTELDCHLIEQFCHHQIISKFLDSDLEGENFNFRERDLKALG